MFIDAADTASVYPSASLLAMTIAADGQLLLKFKSSIGGGTGAEHDSVALTIVADTEKVVMSNIIAAIADDVKGRELVVVRDDIALEGIAGVSSIVITLDS